LFWLAGHSTAAAADTAEWVPEDAALYVELSEPARLVDRLLAPDIVGLLDSVEQFRQFSRSDQFAQLQAVVAYLETRLETNWRRAIADLSGGGVALAFTPGNPDHALLIVRAKDPELLQRANQLLIELAENDAKTKGQASPVKSRDYKGVTAWSLGKDSFHAIVGDTLVFSNRQEGLKAALERNAGVGAKSIAENGAWKQARSRLPAGHAGWAYVKLDLIRQAGIAKELYEAKASNAAIPLFFGGLSHVLRHAPYAVVALTLDDQRLGLRVELPRDESPWPVAFRGFYASQPGEEAAVPLRPARTIASLSFYRDLKAIWDTREQLVTEQVLPQLTELETNLGQVLFGGREFSNEVLGEFEPRIRLVVASQDYSRRQITPDIKLPAAALVLELKRPEEFSPELVIAYHTVLGLVNLGFGQQNQPRFMLSLQEYKDFKIQGARFFERAAAKPDAEGIHLRHNFSPACATAGRYFVLGSTIEIVEDVIDALGNPAAPPETTGQNIILEADMAQVIHLLSQNKETLVSQSMVQNGNTREQAEQEISVLLKALGLFANGRFSWTADPTSMHVDLAIRFADRAEHSLEPRVPSRESEAKQASGATAGGR
jgi:hypothetical protein